MACTTGSTPFSRLTPEQKLSRLNQRVCALLRNLALRTVTTAGVIQDTDGKIIFGTAAANAADQTLTDPAGQKGRMLEFANYSGNTQAILSHAGSTIKASSGAAIASVTMPNAAAGTTAGARLRFLSDGIYWYIV